MRLYSEFLQSDVIVASPLGLTTLLTEAAGAGDAGAADFLTSIEIAVVARADVLLMQNWMHVAEGGCTLQADLQRLPLASLHLHTSRAVDGDLHPPSCMLWCLTHVLHVLRSVQQPERAAQGADG